MQVSYQRDLYRIWLRFLCDKEEKDFGYILQMCIRNHVGGLLPCHLQHEEGRLSICWDMTSRVSLSSLLGEGLLDCQRMRLLFESLLEVMDHMEAFLLPCEYLLLDPSYIFLDAGCLHMDFVCDFEDAESFHRTILLLGEYILEHMDHRDKMSMRLGYEFYRLALGESFDKAGLRRLLGEDEESKDQRSPSDMPPFKEVNEKKEAAMGQEEFSERDEPKILSPIMESEEVKREKILQSLQREEEQSKKQSKCHPLFLCGLGIFLAILGMEAAVFFRNGQHIEPGWLLLGLGLFLLCCLLLTLAGLIGKRREKGRASKADPAPEASHLLEKDEEISKDFEKWSAGKKIQWGQASYEMPFPGAERNLQEDAFEGFQETVVLSDPCPAQKEAVARLTDDEGNVLLLEGRQWILGKEERSVDICIPGSFVSRMHARIYKKEGGYYLEDINSRNGTFLNGTILHPGQSCLLSDGDRVTLADRDYSFSLQ